MNRCVVYLNGRDGFINLEADRIEEADPFFVVFRGETVIGVFDKCAVIAMYLTGRKEQDNGK